MSKFIKVINQKLYQVERLTDSLRNDLEQFQAKSVKPLNKFKQRIDLEELKKETEISLIEIKRLLKEETDFFNETNRKIGNFLRDIVNRIKLKTETTTDFTKWTKNLSEQLRLDHYRKHKIKKRQDSSDITMADWSYRKISKQKIDFRKNNGSLHKYKSILDLSTASTTTDEVGVNTIVSGKYDDCINTEDDGDSSYKQG
ncbi:hypothetical protein Btru_013271 [Bulinus truncatus]|nr:hypothetical protein Btru_013271 [Bulinus truncatus]